MFMLGPSFAAYGKDGNEVQHNVEDTAEIAKCSGGSPFQLFLNERLRGAKRLAAQADLGPRGALRPEVLQRVRDDARVAWQALPAEGKEAYGTMYRARLAERRTEAVAKAAAEAQRKRDGGDNSEACDQHSLWGLGSQSCAVHPKFLQQVLGGGQRLPPGQQVYGAREFVVEDPLPGDLLGEGVVLDSCCHLGRNLCALHPNFDEIMKIHTSMVRLCERVGKQAMKTGDTLVIFEALQLRAGGADSQAKVFALATNMTYSPKFVDWTICHVVSEGRLGIGVPLSFPLEVDIGFQRADLGHPALAAVDIIEHETSAELSRRLFELSGEWRLRVAQYDLVSPLRMRVVGVEPAPQFDMRCSASGSAPVAQVARKGDKSLNSELQDALNLNAMLDDAAPTSRRSTSSAIGAGRAHRSRSHKAHRRHAEGGESDREDIFGSDSEEDLPEDDCQQMLVQQPQIDCRLEELSADILMPAVDRGDLLAADMEQEMAAATLDGGQVVPGELDVQEGLGASTEGGGPSASISDGIDAAVGVLNLAAELAGVMAEDEGEAKASGAASSASASADPLVTADAASGGEASKSVDAGNPPLVGSAVPGGPDGWSMSPSGYIFCPAGRHRGRITTWGKANVSIRCALHPKCSQAKGRSKVSDGQLVHWLARGVAECMPSGEPGRSAKEMAIKHASLFSL